MAGDWIKVEKELNDKPEVRRIARALRLSRFDIVGRLVSVWSWADSHSFTGSGMDISEDDIDDIADLSGFADALRQVGWLKGRAASLEFPNFGRHNGQSAKRRAMEAERKRLNRLDCDDNADKRPQKKRTRSGQDADQRREEKKENNVEGSNTVVCGGPPVALPPPPDAFPPVGRERLNDVRGMCCADNHVDLGVSSGAARFVSACLEINPSWSRTLPTAIEQAAALEAYRSAQGSVTPRDLEMLKAYYASGLTEDRKKKVFWRPDSRRKFWECFGDVLTHADRWAKETRWKPASARKQVKPEPALEQPVVPVVDNEVAAAELRAMMDELETGRMGEL